MRIIQALSIIIALSTIFLIHEYKAYNNLKSYKDVNSIVYKICSSPEEHEKSLLTFDRNIDNSSRRFLVGKNQSNQSCQEAVNEQFRKNIFRLINGDDLIFKY